MDNSVLPQQPKYACGRNAHRTGPEGTACNVCCQRMRAHVCSFVWLFVCLYVCVLLTTCMYICTSMCVCTCVCTTNNMYVHMYKHVCVYSHPMHVHTLHPFPPPPPKGYLATRTQVVDLLVGTL